MKILSKFWIGCTLVLWVTVVNTPCALAQSPSLPGSADPGRIQERLIPDLDRSEKALERETPALIDTEIPLAEDGFILQSLVLEGVTAFEQDYFSSMIDAYVGQKVDLTTLNHLATRITKIYRDNGFLLSRALIPEQEVDEGVVVIQVIEGFIDDVLIDIDESLLDKDHRNIINEVSKKILSMKPLHGPTLERHVLLLNDLGAVEIKTLLKKTDDENADMGAVHLLVEVKEGRSTTAISVDNYGSRFVGPHQVRAFYTHVGLFNAFDNVVLSATVVDPISELQFGSIAYETLLNSDGLSMAASVSYSNSEPGLSLLALDTHTNSFTTSAELSYAYIRSRQSNLILTSGFELKNTSSEFLDEELLDDKTRSLYLRADYDTFDAFNGRNIASLKLSKGFDFLGAEKTGASTLSRSQGRSDYLSLRMDLTRQQALSSKWFIANSMSAQWSPHPLLSAQEFGYGGIAMGRAYDPSEITGDQGVSASAELRYSPDMNNGETPVKTTPFVFYDLGKVWNHDTGTPPQSAASAGFGSYVSYGENVSGALQIAWPLTKEVDTPVMNGERGPRVLFSLSTTF